MSEVTIYPANLGPGLDRRGAFFGDHALRQTHIDRLHGHRAAENLIAGQGWRGGKGCAIGCTFEKYDHWMYQTVLNLPVSLAYLVDAVFEGLPAGKREEFADTVLPAIAPGSDVSRVIDLVAIDRLTRCLNYVVGNAVWARQCRAAITTVIELLGATDSFSWAAARVAARVASWELEAESLLRHLRAAPMVKS